MTKIRYNRIMVDSKSGEIILERMVRAVERVRERLLRATTALEKAGIPYAVVGGNAVAAWVARMDEAAVRNTQDVDIMIRRADVEAATAALTQVGFVRRHVRGIDLFLDGPRAKARDAVHVVFAGERVRPEYSHAAPDVSESESIGSLRVVTLDALIRMKLTSFRLKDRVHLLDMLEVGLMDSSWLARLPPDLSKRLQELIANPDA
jgi:hypothetical protein